MDPSITSKTTILFDVTTMYMIDRLIKDDADDHGSTTISNGVTCDVLL
jgi:hypothetical protein